MVLAQPVLMWTDNKGEVHYTNDPSSVPKGVKAVPMDLSESGAELTTTPSAVSDAGWGSQRSTVTYTLKLAALRAG
ncbi:MAG: DUF4124 domain-containing protein [Myxococcaceae bacterium]|nr:DUF4124 domain-containing protein [Myxococcaceae bacterium]